MHGAARPSAGGSVVIDASASSQFVSGLLLAGARFDDGVTVVHEGNPVPSEPHLQMTVETLRDCGVVVDDDSPTPGAWSPARSARSTSRSSPTCRTPDRSWLPRWCAGGRVTVADWPQCTTQAGDGLRDLLDQMGAEVAWTRRA